MSKTNKRLNNDNDYDYDQQVCHYQNHYLGPNYTENEEGQEMKCKVTYL